MGPNVWIRNRRRTRAWAAIAVVWAVALAVMPFIQGDFRGQLSLAGDVILAVVYLGIAGLGLAVAVRVARAGVSIESDGIIVRGPFTTRVVSLADAESFVPGLQGGWGNGTPCPTLKRRHGRPVGVWALGRRNVVFRYQRLFKEIQPRCDELNELVESQR
jgi:hypothetical protein